MFVCFYYRAPVKMGGRSSKSNNPEHVNYMEDIQQSYYEDKTILHEGPIHTICSVNENLIVSGGADKVNNKVTDKST